MQRYNIAFLPVDTHLQKLICDLSQQHFGAIHDEYVLGDSALAHVTLCQFYADGDAAAKTAFQSFLPHLIMHLDIEEFQVRPGKLINAGKFIAEYKIKPVPELIALQAQCARHLEQAGLQVLTPTAGYSPHITTARLSAPPPTVPALSDLPGYTNLAMRLSLGLSTEPGVYVRELA